MRVVGERLLLECIGKHAETKFQIQTWLSEVKGADWNTPQDIKSRYPAASFLRNRVVIFNMKGNKYRLETKVSFKNGEVRVVWIGPHKEYKKRNKLLKR
jgi:mRNA interferase HigB